MGQEQSTPIDESVPPETLERRTVDGIAKYLTPTDNEKAEVRKIVVLTGAGISTSAGIPDFRSPDTGLYANLARLNLPYAEAVFDISYFRQNPDPFYALAHELFPGRYRPTITHSFLRLLHEKGYLLKVFTQNIDCLEREAGVPEDKIVEAHGSFATHSCIECHSAYPNDAMRAAVTAREVPHCPSCNGLVKPDIVFFGEALPPHFFANRELPALADLCIIIGTSLSVHPFASLPQFVREGVPRLLINNEAVGGLGSRRDDVLVLGDCDSGVRKLAAACGWLDELEKLWLQTALPTPGQKEETAGKAVGSNKVLGDGDGSGEGTNRTASEEIEDVVERLTREVDVTLRWSDGHCQRVMGMDGGSGGGDSSGDGEGDAVGEGLAHVFPHLYKGK